MPTGYYVIAQEQHSLYRIKLLVGPFRSMRAAGLYVMPVQRTGRYKGCTITAHVHRTGKGVTLPRGSFDLSLINPVDVIEASRKLEY